MKYPTRKKAIDANCKECIYDPLAGGTWLEQVEKCITPHCALYSFRPLTNATKAVERQIRFDNMTPSEQVAFTHKQNVTRERFSK